MLHETVETFDHYLAMRKVIVVCLCVLLSGASLSWLLVRSSSVSRSLATQIQRGPGTVIDFAEVAPFPWDRLYIFGPYTSPEHVQKSLGFSWPEYWRTSIQDSKRANLVVFVRERQVVHWFEHPRKDGELGYLDDPKGYARGEAHFRVQREGTDGLVLKREDE